MWFNLYYLDRDNTSCHIDKLSLEGIAFYAKTILTNGGEITGIINVEEDR
jgi:hypothetical protein